MNGESAMVRATKAGLWSTSTGTALSADK